MRTWAVDPFDQNLSWVKDKMVFAENTIFFHFFSINDVVLYEKKDFGKIKYRMKYLINVFKRIDGKR